jgi:hypothetical protein
MVVDLESALLARLARRIKGQIFEFNTDSILYLGKPLSEIDGVRCLVTSDRRLKGQRKLPTRVNPPPQPTRPWRELSSEEEAAAHVLAGGSLCIEALAGCGKSTLLRRMASELRAQGKRVMMTAVTHVATANLEDPEAQTLSRLTYSYGAGVKTRPDVLTLDEFSLPDGYLWAHLATLCFHARCQ